MRGLCSVASCMLYVVLHEEQVLQLHDNMASTRARSVPCCSVLLWGRAETHAGEELQETTSSKSVGSPSIMWTPALVKPVLAGSREAAAGVKP